MENTPKKEHRYRVSLYLGKDLYNKLSGMAQMLDLPLATTTRILLETGVQIGTALESKAIESVDNYGKS